MDRYRTDSDPRTIQAYLDGSESDNLLTLVGMAATALTWERFGERWAEVLQKHSVSVAHMREHREPLFIDDLEVVLRDFGDQEDAFCAASSVILPFHKAVSKGIRTIDIAGSARNFPKPSELCAYDCLNYLCWHYRTEQLDLLFDRNEPFFAKLYKPWNLGSGRTVGHPHLARVRKMEQGSPESHRPLQAADFVAWHVNRFWTKGDQPNSWTLGSIASTSSSLWDQDALADTFRIKRVLTSKFSTSGQ